MTLSGTNNYGGSTSITANATQPMTVTLSNAASYPAGSSLSLSSSGALATLNSPAGAVSVGDLSGTLNTEINLGTGGMSVNTTMADTFAGQITGAGGLSLDGVSLTLSNSNSYGGGTVLLGGTFAITQSSSAGTGSISFNGDSTFQFKEAVTISNAIGISGGITGVIDTDGTISSITGNITGAGSLTLTNSSTTNASTLFLSGGNAYMGSTLISTGNQQITVVIQNAGAFPTAQNNLSLVSSGVGEVTLNLSALSSL